MLSNKVYSKYGVGPTSKKSLPFYVGRWLDNATARIRVLPNASN